MALTVCFVSAIDLLLYGFFPLCNVLPQSILDQRIQADLLRHCAKKMGRIRTALTWNTRVRKKEISADNSPLFKAVKNEEP